MGGLAGGARLEQVDPDDPVRGERRRATATKHVCVAALGIADSRFSKATDRSSHKSELLARQCLYDSRFLWSPVTELCGARGLLS